MRRPPRRPFGPRTRATDRRRSLGVGDDLELDVAPVPGGHDTQEAANRVRDTAVAADHTAHVLLVDGEGEDRLISLVLDLDDDRVRFVDQRSRDVLQEFLHDSAFSASSPVAGSDSAWGSAASASVVASASDVPSVSVPVSASAAASSTVASGASSTASATGSGAVSATASGSGAGAASATASGSGSAVTGCGEL